MFFLSGLLELNLNLQIKIFTQRECEQIHILMSQTATNLQWSSKAGLILKNSILSPVFTASLHNISCGNRCFAAFLGDGDKKTRWQKQNMEVLNNTLICLSPWGSLSLLSSSILQSFSLYFKFAAVPASRTEAVWRSPTANHIRSSTAESRERLPRTSGLKITADIKLNEILWWSFLFSEKHKWLRQDRLDGTLRR